MRILIRFAVIVVLLFSPSLSFADLDKGLAAYDEGDYATAMAECLPLAEAGDAAAQFCVGRMYANGFGVSMDDAEALKWFGLAAQRGHAEAQFNLGVMYANGWGVAMDDAEAAKYYRQAAEQGFPCAARSLAYVTSHGIGVAQDPTDAYTWYVIAAELGDATAREKRDVFAEELSDDARVTAERRANEWLAGFDSAALPAGRPD